MMKIAVLLALVASALAAPKPGVALDHSDAVHPALATVAHTVPFATSFQQQPLSPVVSSLSYAAPVVNAYSAHPTNLAYAHAAPVYSSYAAPLTYAQASPIAYAAAPIRAF